MSDSSHDLKVGREEPATEPCSVVLRFPIRLGEPSLLTSRQGPDLNFRGRTVKSNAPCRGFASALSLHAGNLSLLPGGQQDVFVWGADGAPLDVPTMPPGNVFVFEGSYSGLVPEGLKKGAAFTLEITVDGVGSFEWSELEEVERKGSRYRERLEKLEPNHDSALKIEEYAFGMEFELTLGKKCRLEGRVSPDTQFRISSIVANVPCPSFARVSTCAVANVVGVGCGGPTGTHVLSLIERPAKDPAKQGEMVKIPPPAHVEGLPTVTCKSGAIDLWNFRDGRKAVDLPTLSPANTVGFSGFYDGKVPDGYKEGEVFRLSIMFAGCASICG